MTTKETNRQLPSNGKQYREVPLHQVSMNGFSNKKQRFFGDLEFFFFLNLGSLVNSAASPVGYWQTKLHLMCHGRGNTNTNLLRGVQIHLFIFTNNGLSWPSGATILFEYHSSDLELLA